MKVGVNSYEVYSVDIAYFHIFFVFIRWSKRSSSVKQQNEFVVTDVFFIKNIEKVIAVGNVTMGEFKTGDEVIISVDNQEYKDKIIKIESIGNTNTTVAIKGDNVGFMLGKISKDTIKVGSKIYR